MAMQQLLFSEDALSDADIEHMLTEETTFGGNNNQLIANKLYMKNFNTHNSISQQHHQKPILGQIGLSRVMNKYQNTEGSSNANGRITQPMNCHGLQVSEIVRDHVITISTRQHISISNQDHVFPNRPVFENMVHGVINQTPIDGLRSSGFTDISGFQPKHNIGGVGNSSHFHLHSHEMNDQVIHPNFQLNCNSRGLKLPLPRASSVFSNSTMEHQPKFDELQEQKNHAPYKCSKCGEGFITTQCYATHVMAHYQHEKKVERLKRQESKRREKLHLVQSNNGVLSEDHRSKKPKMTVKTVAVAKKE